MNTYKGTFDNENWYQVTLNDWVFDPNPSLKVRNHSPDGFSWSYNGSGCAQLALAILLKETDEETAVHNYQDFKWEVISNFPQEGFTLTSQQVKEWLKKHEKRN